MRISPMALALCVSRDPPVGTLTIRMAADHLVVSERTIRRYIASGRIKAMHVGPRLIRIARVEFARFKKASEEIT